MVLSDWEKGFQKILSDKIKGYFIIKRLEVSDDELDYFIKYLFDKLLCDVERISFKDWYKTIHYKVSRTLSRNFQPENVEKFIIKMHEKDEADYDKGLSTLDVYENYVALFLKEYCMPKQKDSQV